MKFLVPNYSCHQKPWLGGYRPQIPVLSVLNWISWTPTPEQNSWKRHWWLMLCFGRSSDQNIGKEPYTTRYASHYRSIDVERDCLQKQWQRACFYSGAKIVHYFKFFIIQLMHINYIKIWIIKTFQIITVAPTCFGLRKPSSGSHTNST
jgi:hypothetical protein